MQSTGIDFKSQVLAAVNIVELIGRSIALKKRGRNYLGLCPFHSEKSPSFSVDPVKQFFHCFGCKASGNAIDFVIKRDRIEFIDALKQLGQSVGLEMPQRNSAASQKAGQRQQLLDAQSAAGAFFGQVLASPAGEPARAYLAQRGFNEESIRRFQIGMAPNSWDGLLGAPALRKFPPPLLAEAGLVKAREGGGGFYDTFRNRLMFPIRDENGRVIAFGGRVMPGSDDKTAKYLNSPETPLFSKSRSVFGLDLARQRIIESRTVAVVEGYTDVVMAHQYGASNVVATLGTAMTEQHVSILKRFADKIVLLFDSDTAGDKAVDRAVELFLTRDIEIAIGSLPEGVDPDEFLIAHGAEGFEGILKNTADVLTFKWKQLTQRFADSGNDLTARQKAVQEYMEVLASARGSGPVDALRWGGVLARVSRLSEIPVDELNRRFKPKRAPRKQPFAPSRPAADPTSEPDQQPTPEAPVPVRTGPLTARDRAERWIMAILLGEPQRWFDVQQTVHLADFADPECQVLAEIYWNHQRDEGEPVFNEFLGTLPAATAELAVMLMEQYQEFDDCDARLNDALAMLAESRESDDQNKLLAALRRTDVQAGNGTGDDDSLRQMQERARRPNLRRVGS